MRNYAEVIDAYDAGRFHQYEIRKVSGACGGQLSFDLSYSGGLPLPNYYATAPLEMAVLNGDRGIYKGKGSGKKYIHKICALTLNTNLATSTLTLYDYIAYVPFIDLDSTDEQTIVPIELPRYKDGAGLRVMAVSQGAGVNNTNLTMTYINQDGVEKSATTRLDALNAGAGTVICTGTNNSISHKYLKFSQGDYGIRSIVKVRSDTAVGAICCLVIVKPLCSINLMEYATPMEVDFLIDRGHLIEVHDDAYINMVMFNNSVYQQIPSYHGYVNLIWE